MKTRRHNNERSGKSAAARTASKSNIEKRSGNRAEAISPELPSRAQPGRPATGFPIVGAGASAGGLEAFTQLLKHLPLETGMGFVLVQHLDPVHASALTQLLSKATAMPVREVTNDLRVKPNHVYVIPPNAHLIISQGVLKLKPRPAASGTQRSIDFFFQSLAQDQHERAIGIILSGVASDGTLGLEAVKAEGGITFAQDQSAKYDSMPSSAVAAGCVDFVLPPEKIAGELARIARHPLVRGGGSPASAASAKAATQKAEAASPAKEGLIEDGFKKILLLLRNHSAVDFSLYKSNTIVRRINRRMVLNKLETMDAYAEFLEHDSKELEALHSDVLINVTGFFRDAEAFDVLKRAVFPKLIPERRSEPVRMWVLGCSTGQEAYSIAMAFTEFCDALPQAPKLQIFATDINDALLDKARAGLYSKSVVQDVSPQRLRRFFVEEDGNCRVIKPLREAVIFARQNLLGDPPFSRMDLITCRNLLIYLEPALQKKVIPTFHYALRPNGFLFLGASESIGGFTDLFEPVDKKHKIYSRKTGSPSLMGMRLEHSQRAAKNENAPAVLPALPAAGPLELNAQREADRVTRNRYAPPGVLVNAEWQVLQFRGETSRFLKPPTGEATFHVLKMSREGLTAPLRAALNKAKKESKAVRAEKVPISQDGKTGTANIEVVPLRNLKELCYLISFEDTAKPRRAGPSGAAQKPAPPGRGPAGSRDAGAARHTLELEEELTRTRDHLQSLQEQSEAAREELQASNEEVMSANEELQSINEELETSKEELESVNEELTTVNEEMANRNAELSRLNSDLTNLLTSTRLAIVLLGPDLTIRRFSPQAEKQFNLLSTDVGRPIGNVRHNLDLLDLEGLANEVIHSAREREREVRDKQGRWSSLRLHPYRSMDNQVDGVVLVLVDINEMKRREQEIEEARDYAQAIVETVPPLLILDNDLRVTTANRPFYKHFGLSPAQTESQLIYQLDKGQWDIPQLRELLEEGLRQNSFFEGFEVTHQFDRIGRRTLLLSARRMDRLRKILLVIDDITERLQRAQAPLADRASQLERAVAERTQELTAINKQLEAFVYSIAHDLRAPLRAMQGFSAMLIEDAVPGLSETGQDLANRINRSAQFMGALLNDLLAFSRMSQERIELTAVNLETVVQSALSLLEKDIQDKHARVEVCPPWPVVLAHEPTLNLVLFNLVSNALKFVRPEATPVVRLLSQDQGPVARVWVEDNGIGIAPEDQDQVFRVFIRLNGEKYPGTGIGLAIVQKGIERMGGRVGVESTAGHGSRFWFELRKAP